MVRCSPRAPGFQPKQYARPFDQNLESSPLIYFFYVHTTIRQKYMVLFHLVFCARPFVQKLESSLIYFFHLHKTIQQKYMVLFQLFFLLFTTIRPRFRVLAEFISFICTRPLDQIIWSSFIYSFFRPKIRVLINLLILLVRDHSTKNQGPHLLIRVLSNLIFLFVHDYLTKNQGPH